MAKALLLLAPAAAQLRGLEVKAAYELPENSLGSKCNIPGHTCLGLSNLVVKTKLTAAKEVGKVQMELPTEAWCQTPGFVYSSAAKKCTQPTIDGGAVVTECLRNINKVEVKRVVADLLNADVGTVEVSWVSEIGTFVSNELWDALTGKQAFEPKAWHKLLTCSLPSVTFGFAVGHALTPLLAGLAIVPSLVLVIPAVATAVATTTAKIAIGCKKPYYYKPGANIAQVNAETAALYVCQGAAHLANGKSPASVQQDIVIAAVAETAGALTNKAVVTDAFDAGLHSIDIVKRS